MHVFIFKKKLAFNNVYACVILISIPILKNLRSFKNIYIFFKLLEEYICIKDNVIRFFLKIQK